MFWKLEKRLKLRLIEEALVFHNCSLFPEGAFALQSVPTPLHDAATQTESSSSPSFYSPSSPTEYAAYDASPTEQQPLVAAVEFFALSGECSTH